MELDVPLPRIEPRRSHLDLDTGPTPVAEIHLQGVPRGAVLFLCEPGDLAARASELMNGLAEHGYETLAVEAPETLDEDAHVSAFVDGLLARLRERGWASEQTGVVGYGPGATVALRAAAGRSLGGVACLSPANVPALPAPVTSPLLAMLGELDPVLAPDRAGELEQALAASPAFTRVVVYPGVGADFHRDGATALGHAAAFDSWQRVVEWMNVRVEPRPTPYAELWAARQQRTSDPSPRGSVR